MKRTFSEGIGFVQEVHRSGWEEARKESGLDEGEAKEWWAWYERDVCRPWVVYEGDKGIEEIEEIQGNAQEVGNLPLVVEGVQSVRFAGRNYPLAQEGLYRFIVVPQSVRNLIVGRAGQPLAVLRGLSALQIHGNRENGTSVEELRQLLLTRAFISVTCGTIASVTVAIMADLGFRARLVSSLTLEAWNTYDNGHCLCEVFFPEESKWVLTDVDLGFLFQQDGSYLSAYELWQCLREGEEVAFVPLCEKRGDPFFLGPSGFNHYLVARHQWRNLDGKKAWYRRIFQVIGVHKEGRTLYFGPEERIRSYCSGQDFEVLPVDEWRERLYGEASDEAVPAAHN